MCPHLLMACQLPLGQTQLETGGQRGPCCFSLESRQIGRVGLAEQTDGIQHALQTGNAPPPRARHSAWLMVYRKDRVLTEFTPVTVPSQVRSTPSSNIDSFTGKEACRQVLKAWNCAERQPELEGQLCFTCKKKKKNFQRIVTRIKR